MIIFKFQLNIMFKLLTDMVTKMGKGKQVGVLLKVT